MNVWKGSGNIRCCLLWRWGFQETCLLFMSMIRTFKKEGTKFKGTSEGRFTYVSHMSAFMT